MKGYKGFKKDEKGLYCQHSDNARKDYEVGKVAIQKGALIMCGNGIHYCKNITDVHQYYDLLDSVICEIEILGEFIDGSDGKSVTNKIKVVKELSRSEVLEMANTGKDNTGLFNSGYRNSGDRNSGNSNSGDWNNGNRNSGDWNSGYRNSGYRNSGNRNSGNSNSGNRNSGDWNSGDWNSGNSNSGDWNNGNRNSGDWNSGDWNSGYRNSGDWNSGNRNSGNRNSGDWNSGDWNLTRNSSGVFCTTEPKILIFDQPTDMTLSEWRNTDASRLLQRMTLTQWIFSEYMTEEEKATHENYKTLGGYLKTYSYKEACQIMWDSFSEHEKNIIKTIPNFNAVKFKKITGIEV